MRRGEVWWVEFGGRRPFVLLSGDPGDPGAGFEAVQIVEAADASVDGAGLEELCVEVPVGPADWLPFAGVARFAFPRPSYTPCTWQTTLSAGDLAERAGEVPEAKVAEIEAAIRECAQPRPWTPGTLTRFNEIRNALRAGWTG